MSIKVFLLFLFPFSHVCQSKHMKERLFICSASVFKNLTRHTFLIIFMVAAILLTELSLHTAFFHVQRFLEANCREASLLEPSHMVGAWPASQHVDAGRVRRQLPGLRRLRLSCYRHSPVKPGLATPQSH